MLINERIKGFLGSAYQKGRLASAILLYGPRGVGKFATALDFVSDILSPGKKLVYPHSDLKFVVPTKKDSSENEAPDAYGEFVNKLVANPHRYFPIGGSISIPIAAIRSLSKWLSYSAMTGNLKVAIILEAGCMTTQAQNAFLKTLEEPPENSYLILTCSNPDKLLPTIKSRVQGLLSEPLSKQSIVDYLTENYKIDKDKARLVANLADGSLMEALAMLERKGDERKVLVNLLHSLFANDELGTINFIRQKRDIDLSHFLVFLLSFIRDIIVLKESRSPERLINSDLLDFARKLSKEFSTETISEYFQRVRQSIGMLESYPNKDLLILSLHRKIALNSSSRIEN